MTQRRPTERKRGWAWGPVALKGTVGVEILGSWHQSWSGEAQMPRMARAVHGEGVMLVARVAVVFMHMLPLVVVIDES